MVDFIRFNYSVSNGLSSASDRPRKKKIDQDRILIEDGKIVETAVVRVLDGAIVLSMCEPV